MEEINNRQEFHELSDKAKLFYQGLGELFCPALNAKVRFNSDGFHHLRYERITDNHVARLVSSKEIEDE